MNRKYLKSILIVLVCFILDRLSKMLIVANMSLGDSVKVIDGFFYIHHVINTGAAWSMFNRHTYLLTLLSIVAIVILLYLLRNSKGLSYYAILIIIGGALGNLYDRVLYGYVVDFLDFIIIGYDYPVFNIADSFVVIGFILLVIDTLRGNK
ncbi:MAG: signal peptidase II [Erysipelotrichaceae bacterium]|nr:signal peptidase II [Erysipelotrichaceae bacterium]